MSKTVYLFANWKMYLSFKESEALAKSLAKRAGDFSANVTMSVFPGALAVNSVRQILKGTGIAVGAQNIYWVDKGGYTGETSARMFRDVGCQYCLVGHSERRHQFHESNADTRQKIEAAVSAGLTPVLCAGETLKERRDNRTEQVVGEQLEAALTGLKSLNGGQLIVAYEPVWAIGTGTACHLADVNKEHIFIRKFVEKLLGKIDLKILYGGSVRPENAAEFMVDPHVDGVLVGGASTKLGGWLKIVRQASVAIN